MSVYRPLLTDTLSPAPIYIVFRGTSTIFDYFRDLNILLDYSGANPISLFNSEMTSIYNTLKSYITTQNRAIHIVCHSLGAMYGIHLLHSLIIQESPNLDHIESAFKLTMFNPLLLSDDATQYFRTEALRTYAKTNINIHSIRGDFLSPLLTRAGVGKVHMYDNTTPPVVDETDFLLGTWLSEVLGTQARSSYLNDDNHKIAIFGGNATGLQQYVLVNPLGESSQTMTIITKVQKDIQHALGQTTAQNHHLYVFDKDDNLDSSKQFVDYPEVTHVVDNYNYVVARYSDLFILSQVGNVYYINFQVSISPESDANKFLYRYLVKKGENEYLLSYTETQSFKITDVLQPTLPLELTLDNTSVFDDVNTQAAHKNRFLFNIGAAAVNAAFHQDLRRTGDNTPPITYTGLEALFQTPSNGYGYFNIKMIGTATSNPNYLYMEDGTNLTVYARPAPTSEGQFGISHTDNSTNPDEHVWKVSKVAGSTNLFTVQNTAYPTKYLGSMGSISGTTPALNTPPQLLIEEDSFVTTTDYYHMSLKGTNNTDYMAYWYVVNSLYHYVDFNGLNNTNYNINNINFKFEPI